MSVYLDNDRNAFGRMKMCHMIADTLFELFRMARKIGLRSDWIQQSKSGVPHFDVSLSRRKRAIELGAVVLDRKAFVEKMQQWKK